METFKRVVPVLLHLVLIAAIIFIWEFVPKELPEMVAERLKEPPNPKTLSIAAYIFAVVLILVVIYVFDHLLRTPLLALLFRDKALAKFEGTWAQKVSITDRPYSIGLIKFNANSGLWEYNGVGFVTNLTPGATWHTESLRYDQDKGLWYFGGEARILDPRQKGAIYSVVPILEIPDGPANRLTGWVADVGADRKRTIFDIEDMRPLSLPPNFSGDLSTTDTIKLLTPDQVRQLLTHAKLLQPQRP
jgi:hypothetical protein